MLKEPQRIGRRGPSAIGAQGSSARNDPPTLRPALRLHGVDVEVEVGVALLRAEAAAEEHVDPP